MTTHAATLATVKSTSEKRLLKIRQQAVVIRDLREINAELRECLARAREKLWDQLSIERINGVLGE